MTESEKPIPWAEARPPHLPDRLTAIPLAVWPFVAIAVLAVVFAGRDLAAASLGVEDAIPYVTSYLPTVLTALLGAALFWRHPDAWRTSRWVAIGLSLLAVGELLQLLSPGLQEAFGSLTPPMGDLSFLVPASLAYGLVAKLVGIIGIVALARGLREARRHDDVGSSRPLAVVLLALVGVVLAATIGWWPTYEGASAADMVSVVISLVTAAALQLAWIVLIVTIVAGRRAGEAPPGGWLAASIGGLALVAGWILSTVVTVVWSIGAIDPSTYPMDLVLPVYAILGILPWALLLVAFALGLPATPPTADPSAASSPDSGGS